MALKVLKGGTGARWAKNREALKSRLVHEARSLARVSHPNVVHVYDVGEFGEHLYIAMELVEGVTLRQWLSEGRRSWQEVRDLFIEAGEGLVAAHEVGLLHRDFKPDNVLIGEDGRVRVLDFGLARALELPEPPAAAAVVAPNPNPLAPRSEGGQGAVGTPAYMAPEQYASRRLDVAVDQFAFCVSLFEALHGARPFVGRTVQDLAAAVLYGRVTRPRTSAKIPGWLDKVVMKGLSVDPGQRHPSLRALLQALRSDTKKRRLQWGLLASAVVLTASLTFTAVSAVEPEPAPEPVERIEALVEQGRDSAERRYYVYPSADDPELVTAYRAVMELEKLAAQGSRIADERAAELRQEFAEMLASHGDAYHQQPGAESFAADYYMAALLFDPDLERARSRAPATPGDLEFMRRRAQEQDFSEADIAVGESLAALAEPDPDRRRRRVERARANENIPVSTAARLERVAPRRARSSGSARVSARSPEPSTPAEVAVTEDPVVDVEAGEEEHTRQPGAAKREAKLGRNALRRGKLDAAGQHFHRALKHDRKNLSALLGLAELKFQQGAYSQAVEFAQKASRLQSTDVRGYMIAGNAYFRMLRYDAARDAYAKAAARGHEPAKRRLKKLEGMLGEKPGGKENGR